MLCIFLVFLSIKQLFCLFFDDIKCGGYVFYMYKTFILEEHEHRTIKICHLEEMVLLILFFLIVFLVII